MSIENNPSGRRGFFTWVLRAGVAAVLGAVTAKLVMQSQEGPLHPDEKCTNRGLCRGCPVLKGCTSLPAEMFRRGQKDA
jgi:hypothetical protein